MILTANVMAPQACAELADPANGRVDTSNGTLIDALAVYSCNTGFQLSGNRTRTCDREGMWTGSEPECRGKYTES